MAINKNHEFEELQGIKCAIVERNVSQERVDFLKRLLEVNRYTVVVVPAAPPKAAAAAAPAGDGAQPGEPAPDTTLPPPATFTIGVTDLSFNPINAIFGRLLRTANGRVVTLAYWRQVENVSDDETPYFQKR